MLFTSGLSVAESATVSRSGRSRPSEVSGPALIAAGLLAVTLAGCAARPFNVKPRVSLGKPDYRVSGQIDGLGIQAEAMTDEDYLYEIFDANLIQAGVYPVRIRVTNNKADALELKRARFEIKSSAGKPIRATQARQAYKRLIKYYELSLSSKDGYKRSLNDFGSHAFDTQSPLGPGDSREGILFFLVPAQISGEGSLILEAARLGRQSGTDALELKLK